MNKDKTSVKIGHIICAICFGVIVTFVYSAYAAKTEKSLSASVIRLHVIANSDTEEDQELKLKVRDAIIDSFGDVFAPNGDIEDARADVVSTLDSVNRLAQEVVIEQGYNYPVRASLGKSDFPTKVYGKVTLPAGTYEALKIVIGSGGGQNWWCVLFPPLCFVDGTTAEIPDESKAILKNSLSAAEYDMITQKDELPVEVRFKVYEIWQQSKLKIKNMIASVK